MKEPQQNLLEEFQDNVIKIECDTGLREKIMIRNSAEVQRRKIKRGHTENKGKERKRRNLIFFTGDSFVFMSCCVRACHTKYNVITKLPFETKESGN